MVSEAVSNSYGPESLINSTAITRAGMATVAATLAHKTQPITSIIVRSSSEPRSRAGGAVSENRRAGSCAMARPESVNAVRVYV